jgi:serine phosphatase RsbU (regulator of sigma subunit)
MNSENSKISESRSYFIQQILLALGLAFILLAITFVKKIFQFSIFDFVSSIVTSALLITVILIVQPFANKFEKKPVEGIKFMSIFLLPLVGISFAFKNFINIRTEGNLINLLSYSDVILTNVYCLIYVFLGSIVFSIFLKVLYLGRGREAKIKFVASLIFFAIIELLEGIFENVAFLPQILLIIQLLLLMWISFKIPWVIGLPKREKYKVLLYSFFGIFFTFLLQSPFITGNSSEAMKFYSPLLFSFTHFYLQPFLIIYLLFAFGSAIFHLPTTEIYERKVTELSTLQNIGKLVAQVPDVKEFCETALGIAMEITNSKSAWIELEFPTGVEIYGSPRIGDEFKILMNEIGSVKSKFAIQNFKERYFSTNLGGKNVLVISLITHGKNSGFMYLVKTETFGEDEINLSLALADQIAIGVENSRLIRELIEKERLTREFELARQMQNRLLPKFLPTSDKLEVSVLFVPAFEVGGDYYDFIIHENGNISVVVADVSGKGVSAAFYMAQIKGIFQSLAKVYPKPLEFISKLNEIVFGQVDRKFFITLVYAYFDLKNDMVQIARAGHSPPILVKDGKVDYLKSSGVGIGLIQTDLLKKFVKTVKLKLKKDDVVVLYSDGVIEAMNERNEEFGYERLEKLLCEVYRKNSKEIVKAIFDNVANHQGEANQIDDITILVVKWKK